MPSGSRRNLTTITRESEPGVWTHVSQGKFCAICGAWLGCLGLEPTPELYVAHLVAIFEEVRRVLREDGTLLAEHRRLLRWPAAAAVTPAARAVPSRLETQHQEAIKERLASGSAADHRSVAIVRNAWRQSAQGRAWHETEGPRRRAVDGRLRVARSRLVSPVRRDLVEAQPDAGVGEGPADEGARIRVSLREERVVFLRR
jgi:hypothetical protein